MLNDLRNFLALSYDQLEQLNLKAKEQRKNRVAMHKIQEERLKYLTDEKHIKAVTVLFSDLEGRLHMLDYDKKFLLKSWDNLTFDGSSIRGFTAQRESDLRLGIDWAAFYWGPADYFGSGKVLVFGDVIDKGGTPYAADIRGILKMYADELYKDKGYTLNAANEIEGFLFKGVDAERRYNETGKFEYVNTGGYYHSLPGDPLRTFIDTTAEVQRAMGFQNEKDHPEVAPSQFEINYGYGEVVAAADQIQIYKLVCRQVATHMGLTASFLPKPVVGVNGSGMHTNVSISKGGKNLFWDPKGEEKLSKLGWSFVDRILTHGNDICLLLNPSVNAYRRLDPHFEAPNQTQGVGRGSRFHDSHSHRQREEHAGGGAIGGPGCESLHGHAVDLQDRNRRRHGKNQEPASGGALSAGQYLRRHGKFQQGGVDDEAFRPGRERAVSGLEKSCGRPLSAVC